MLPTVIPTNSTQIAAVIVTYNRLDLLKEALAAVRGQSRKPNATYVIDNGSTDGTTEWLDSQPDLRVVHQANLGGAGGFHTGIRVAFEAGFDWFWLMDDDTIADRDALERMIDTPAFSREDTGFLSSKVFWIDGSLHPMNRQIEDTRLPAEEQLQSFGAVRVLSASFVSMLLPRRAAARFGLPLKEFFIWFDDTEYSKRICAKLPGYIVPQSRVVHKTKHNLRADEMMWRDSGNPKALYGWRNYSYLRKLHAGTGARRFMVCAGILARRTVDCLMGRLHPQVLLWTLQGFRMRLTPDPLAEPVPEPHSSSGNQKLAATRKQTEPERTA
jgi:GT2 family glycosyltransferase